MLKRAALLALTSVAACAVIRDPRGGPPDFTPPTLLSVRPDSGSVDSAFDGSVRFQFDEVISEQSGGGLDKLVTISPRPSQTDVSWKRDAIEVHPDHGWLVNVTYTVSLHPGVTDLSNNKMATGAATVFSTGGPIPETDIKGIAVDWTAGHLATNALIEAIRPSDSLTFVGATDSTGAFRLPHLPTGPYALIATIDANRNGRRDRREAFDSVAMMLDSTYSDTLWLFVHDTVGPRIKTVDRVDSTALRVQFTDMLEPIRPDTAAVHVFRLPDSVAVAVASVWRRSTFDSLQQAAKRAADTSAHDTTGAPSPTPLPPSAPRGAESAAARQPTPPQPSQTTVRADTGAAAAILAARPKLEDTWVVRLADPLVPATRYVVEARAANVNGAVAESRGLFVPPDTTRKTRK